jgi:DNA-binding IscR family transcriptional regulator
MKVSAQEEYGLRCLLQLARLSPGESLTLGQIAEGEGISQANAGKLMWLLNKAGLVAEEIHLSDIIKVLDEDMLEGHCKSYTGLQEICVHTGDCGIRPVLISLHEIVQSALERITLAQLTDTESNVDQALYQIHVGMSRGVARDIPSPKHVRS